MSNAKSASKKRKRDTTTSEGTTLKLSAHATGLVGPVLVSYPALEAPPSTAFKCYALKKLKGNIQEKSDDEAGEQDLLVVGETDSVEFVPNEEESRKAAGSGCQYLIAVHNTRTSTLNILPTPKNPYIMAHTVKALKSIPPSATPSAVEYSEAKIALGKTFGTKKAKANIRAQERNRVDVDAMEGVIDFVMGGIDKGAAGLMSQEEAKTAADNNRLIPPFSATASDPADVYPLHQIIPETEWKALPVSAFDQAGSDQERMALLPFKWSAWINMHVKAMAGETGKMKQKNTILLYISTMLAFRQATHGGDVNKNKLAKQLAGIPSLIVDSLLARFTEIARGSTNHTSTSTTRTNLLTHIFALCLKVDNFATDTTTLAHDLGMSVIQVNKLFKSLGCKMVQLGERERARLGLPDSATEKRAVLAAPVVFPKPRAMKMK